MQSEEKNPQSIMYKRTLVRPKIPFCRLILFFVLLAVAGFSAYACADMLVRSLIVSLASAFAAVLLVGLLLAKHILIAMIKTYQAVAPEGVRNHCRYEPSCSVYMIMALEKYGFWRGFKKGMKRWNSCKPPNGGFDMP